MIWFGISLVIVGGCALLVAVYLRQKRCPRCHAPRHLKDGSRATFCPTCGYWYDRRLGG